MTPSAQYTPLMNNLYEKIWISKVVVEYLEEYHYLQPSYEDLLEIVREATIPELDDMRMTEEMLHKHAQFVCDQVVSLEAQDEEDEPLVTLPCMRELIKLMGIKFGKRRSRKIEYKKVDKQAWTKATTTPLIRKTFESFFSNQLDKTNKVRLKTHETVTLLKVVFIQTLLLSSLSPLRNINDMVPLLTPARLCY